MHSQNHMHNQKPGLHKALCFALSFMVLSALIGLAIIPQDVQASIFSKKKSQDRETYASLSGFEPGAAVTYSIFASGTQSLKATAFIDESGALYIPVPEELSVDSKHLLYDFSIDESHRDISMVLRVNTTTGEFSVSGAGGDPFTDIEIQANGENTQTRADWAGLFEETGIRLDQKQEGPKPIQVAFYSRNVASDAQQRSSPALIRVQNYSGGNASFDQDLKDNIYENYIQPMMLMTEQISAVAMQQTKIIGSFLDAKYQLETQRIHQKLKAEAVKDYHPSEQMCRIGSYMRSLATVEQKGAHDRIVLSNILVDTYTNQLNTSGTLGPSGYMPDRMEQYKTLYCNPNDNSGGLDLICQHGGGLGAVDPARSNKDIDFSRTLDFPSTLDIDFSDANLSDDETDIIALARNLYWPSVFARMNKDKALEDSKYYMRARHLMALNNLSHNTFTKIVGMKARAPVPTGSVQPGWAYMKTMLRDLGLTDIEVAQMAGENPSYYSQMDILTKRIYQNPDFYTNLYDKPTNVDRINTSLEAIRLMQMRDHYEASLRREMLLSGILENELALDAESLQGQLLQGMQ